ncbi:MULTISPECIES: flagellar export protein FliJ [Pontibacillus]|uniref:Flagellar FliJ protein n=1 Tax=Pontibacillus chungwhensis TaxID=265426 RepID=A0ABY8V1Y5_9BACI|nr:MULTISPECIES: flagellar export protein FliJ [Pontibacillus]MCD5322684.1 flagellar export protein FliJ [Pontibacillus sp. HN14]WIF99960.1 flagellar export protein FliJ [Pontibacillus chungwhensis]
MTSLSTFHKLLDLKEQDKHVAQKNYQDSMDQFEDVATRLYQLLKKKENAEAYYEAEVQKGLSITALHSHHAYIEQLSQQIEEVQQVVQEARNNMNDKQGMLSESHIEYKKYELLINRKVEQQQIKVQTFEKQMMDEISVQQYINQGN